MALEIVGRFEVVLSDARQRIDRSGLEPITLEAGGRV